MTYLPDVNVWIALATDKHVHHSTARSWFATLQDEKLAFCRITWNHKGRVGFRLGQRRIFLTGQAASASF